MKHIINANDSFISSSLSGAHRIYSQMLQDDKRPPPLIVQYLGRKFADEGRLDDILEMKKEYEAVIRKTDYPDNSSILGAYVIRLVDTGWLDYCLAIWLKIAFWKTVKY